MYVFQLFFFCILSLHIFVMSARRALRKASKTVKITSVGHQMQSVACIFSGLRCENWMWVQRHLHSRFPTSKKPKNSKKITFFCVFSLHKYMSVRKALWKASKWSKTGLLGIKCCQSVLFCLVFSRRIECEFKINFTVVSQCRKTRKNVKNHCFWPFLTIPRDFCRGKLVSADNGCNFFWKKIILFFLQN